MQQMASFRADARLLADVRRLAEAEGIGAGTWMRRAVSNAVFDTGKPAEIPGYRVTGWKCPHLVISASGTTLGAATAHCGCEMQPVYEPVLAIEMTLAPSHGNGPPCQRRAASCLYTTASS
jgi:hypothetical protein